MKTLRNYLSMMLCGLIATTSFSSCLNSDNDKTTYRTLSQADKTTMMTALAGSYTGKVYYYYYDKTNLKRDSTMMSWVARADSTVTLPNVPTKAIAKYITSSDSTDILQTQSFAVTAKTSIPAYTLSSYFDQGYYQFAMTPQTTTFTAGSKTVTITYQSTMSFVGNTLAAMCTTYQNYFEGYLLISKITVGTNTYEPNLPIAFFGKKV